MNFFSQLLGRSAVRAQGMRPTVRTSRPRPMVEFLEDRTLMNSRFVVPVGITPDNTTSFATLEAALTTAGLTTNDSITILPGSSPGVIDNADLTAAFASAATLTIQSSASIGTSGTPQFLISDAVSVATTNSLILRNVNVGLIETGSLTLNGPVAISGSVLTNLSSSAATAFTFGGSSSNVTNTTFVANVAATASLVEMNTPATGTTNLISGNTFVANVSGVSALLAYSDGVGLSATDQIINNRFIVAAGATATTMILIDDAVNGLLVRDNTLDGSAATGINVLAAVQNLQITRNEIHLTSSGGIAVSVTGGVTGLTSVLINGNILDAGTTGTGLVLIVGAGTFNARVEGNDFHNNQVGVRIVAGVNSIANIDLGGGVLEGLGGNNFRSFTTTATAISGAIITDATVGSISARFNIFSVANPQTVISATGGATVNATSNLSLNAAFVQLVYIELLGRAGDVNDATDAAGWISALDANTITRAEIINVISNSTEGIRYAVNEQYRMILGRDADETGLAFWMGQVQNGTSYDSISVNLFASAEYRATYPSNDAFVTSLYVKLLYRSPDAGGLSSWIGFLNNGGSVMSVVQAFLSNAEYRQRIVVEYYADYMHRTATSSEVNGWANSSLDLYAIRRLFLGSAEYQTNG